MREGIEREPERDSEWEKRQMNHRAAEGGGENEKEKECGPWGLEKGNPAPKGARSATPADATRIGTNDQPQQSRDCNGGQKPPEQGKNHRARQRALDGPRRMTAEA